MSSSSSPSSLAASITTSLSSAHGVWFVQWRGEGDLLGGYWPLEKQPGKRGGGGSSGYKTVGGHPVAAGASNVESLGGGVNEGGGGGGEGGGGRTLQRAEGTPCNVQQHRQPSQSGGHGPGRAVTVTPAAGALLRIRLPTHCCV